MMSGPTLGNGAPEQSLGTGHGRQRADAHGPSRLRRRWLGRLSVDIMLKLVDHELAVADDAIDEVADGDNSQQRSIIDDW